jgi:hypothetical protein
MCGIKRDNTYTPPTDDLAWLDLFKRSLEILRELIAERSRSDVGLLACLEL